MFLTVILVVRNALTIAMINTVVVCLHYGHTSGSYGTVGMASASMGANV